MFLSDINALRKLTKPSAIPVIDPRFADNSDPELDRMFSSSPVIMDYSISYSYEESSKDAMQDNANSSNKIEESKGSLRAKFKQGSSKKPIIFQEKQIPIIDKNIPPPASELGKVLQSGQKIKKDRKNTKGKIPLTIYLPDKVTSMMVYASQSANIGDLIEQILEEHEEDHLDPPLDYANPQNYEILVHDFEGEPDRDFPPFGVRQLISQCEFDEFCLAVKQGKPLMVRHISSNDTLFSPSMFGNGPSSSSGRHSIGIFGPENPSTTKFPSREYQNRDLPSIPIENYLKIKFPNSSEFIDVPYDANETLKSLLPKLAKYYKLRLYTDEYIFIVSNQDQEDLKLMSPIVDSDVPIGTIGSTTFEIHKKVYSDAGGIQRMNRANVTSRRVENNSVDNLNDSIVNTYAEWNVVKRNKFGIKQERIFGLDGQKVYNAKRNQGIKSAGNSAASGVHRAEREISTIIKIQVLANDSKTFRINWQDNNDIYSIDYTCETIQECNEIVQRILYIMEKNRNLKNQTSHTTSNIG